MVIITEELLKRIVAFKQRFHESVPTYQLDPSVTAEDVISAIDKSLEEGKNLLPDIFGYVR